MLSTVNLNFHELSKVAFELLGTTNWCRDSLEVKTSSLKTCSVCVIMTYYRACNQLYHTQLTFDDFLDNKVVDFENWLARNLGFKDKELYDEKRISWRNMNSLTIDETFALIAVKGKLQ